MQHEFCCVNLTGRSWRTWKNTKWTTPTHFRPLWGALHLRRFWCSRWKLEPACQQMLTSLRGTQQFLFSLWAAIGKSMCWLSQVSDSLTLKSLRPCGRRFLGIIHVMWLWNLYWGPSSFLSWFSNLVWMFYTSSKWRLLCSLNDHTGSFTNCVTLLSLEWLTNFAHAIQFLVNTWWEFLWCPFLEPHLITHTSNIISLLRRRNKIRLAHLTLSLPPHSHSSYAFI